MRGPRKYGRWRRRNSGGANGAKIETWDTRDPSLTAYCSCYSCYSVPQEKIQYPVPSSARPHLLGAKGRTLIGIQSKTGVQINVPRREQQETTFVAVTASEDDLDAEEEMVMIDIEGDVESIKAAKEEIDSIVAKVRGCLYGLFP